MQPCGGALRQGCYDKPRGRIIAAYGAGYGSTDTLGRKTVALVMVDLFGAVREGFPQRPFFIGTLVDRETRNARIDARLDARLQEGMIDEIRGLLERGVPAETLISYGLEYKFVTLYLQGELPYAEMREKLAIAIHQFAKRQMTWFRGMERSGAQIHWVDPSFRA